MWNYVKTTRAVYWKIHWVIRGSTNWEIFGRISVALPGGILGRVSKGDFLGVFSKRIFWAMHAEIMREILRDNLWKIFGEIFKWNPMWFPGGILAEIPGILEKKSGNIFSISRNF